MEKRYDFKEAEKKMQQFWHQEQIYQFDSHRQGEVYSIDTPPPTVSGSLHIGHLLSYTQAEMIARFRRMQGYNVFYPFGFDDNGLPTERLIEREEGIHAKDLPRSEFIEKCRETTAQYEAEFKKLWMALGFSVDWSLQYETISPDVRRISQALFLELVEKGKAYTKESPVLWCTECQTSIAQAELYTAEIDSTFNYIGLFWLPLPGRSFYTEFFRNQEKEASIHLTKWEKPQSVDAEILKFGEEVKDTLAGMRKYKSEHSLSMRAEMEELQVECRAQFLNWFKQTEMDLQTCANAKKIEYVIR